MYLHPSPEAELNDADYARLTELCEQFNREYGDRTEPSLHRQRLLEVLKQLRPLYVEALHEAEYIHADENETNNENLADFKEFYDLTEHDKELLEDADSDDFELWWDTGMFIEAVEMPNPLAEHVKDRLGLINTLIAVLSADATDNKQSER